MKGNAEPIWLAAASSASHSPIVTPKVFEHMTAEVRVFGKRMGSIAASSPARSNAPAQIR